MTATTLAAKSKERRYPRILGSYGDGHDGPVLIVTSGIHGNEPAGAEALTRVCAKIEGSQLRLRGRVLALAGNLGALAAGERYIDADLNRMWTPATIGALRAQRARNDSREQREQRELLAIFDRALADEHADVTVLDLHSSSADGPPFSCMGDTIRNRRIAFALPVPVVLGLEETIDGAMLDYVYELGHVAVAVEGGRHGAPDTVLHLEAAVWLSLVAAGCLDRADVPDFEACERRLEQAAAGIPRVLEIRHREELTEADVFTMKPGYKSFDRVAAGELLAHRGGAEVRAKEDGCVLLPLYQGQGSDGFFLCRPVRPFWLGLSRVLRRLRFSRVLPLFPGVRRHLEIDDAYVVDPQVASIKPVEIFHLLGFRRKRRDGDCLVFTRRHERRR